MGETTHNTLLSWEEKRQMFLLTRGEKPRPSLPCAGRGGKEDYNLAPFRATRFAAFTHLLSNVMRSKLFPIALDLDPKLMPERRIKSWLEKFALSYSAFIVQITNLVTVTIARNTLRLSLFHEGSTLSTLASILHPSRIDPGKPIFQRTNSSPDRAFPNPCWENVDNRPVNVAKDCCSVRW